MPDRLGVQYRVQYCMYCSWDDILLSETIDRDDPLHRESRCNERGDVCTRLRASACPCSHRFAEDFIVSRTLAASRAAGILILAGADSIYDIAILDIEVHRRRVATKDGKHHFAHACMCCNRLEHGHEHRTESLLAMLCSHLHLVAGQRESSQQQCLRKVNTAPDYTYQ